MKKQFAKLTKAEQQEIELQYHEMKPGDFDQLMSRAKRHTPSAIRLPSQLVDTLKAMAKLEGEPRYQAMVRRWIEERLQQETDLAVKLFQHPPTKLPRVLKRQSMKRSQARA